MRVSEKLPLVLWGGVVLAVVFLIYSVAEKATRRAPVLHDADTMSTPVDVLRMDGMSYTAHEGGKMRFRLKADRVEVAKRKFGMLYVNPLKEATFSNLDLDVYEDADRQNPTAVLSAEMFAQLLPAQITKEFGVITRIRIDGLHITLYRHGQSVSSITARHAAVDPKTRVTALKGDVSVAAGEGRSIMGQEGTWDQAAGLFSITGPYLFMNAGKITQGNGLRFDLDLRGVRS